MPQCDENVGLQDMSAFAKFEVTGPGAEAWLESILTNKIPKGWAASR